MKRFLVAAATLTVACGLALPAQPAAADPEPVTDYRTWAGVGSDTLQDLWNGFDNGAPAAGIAPTVAGISWWNAYGDTYTIRTRNRPAAQFVRPAGSWAGQKALSRSWDPDDHTWNGVNIAGLADFAASSAGVAQGLSCSISDPSCMLAFLPFARDAISVAVQTAKGDSVAVNLTRDQITAAYNCTAPATASLSDGTWITLYPVLPQENSGTRSTFLKMINVTTPGACVETRGADADGSQIPLYGDMMPFSAGQYIAQRNGVIKDLTGTVTLATIDGKAPFTGTAPKLVPGPLFGSACNNGICSAAPSAANGEYFARDVYNVMLARNFYVSPTTRQFANYPPDRVRGGALNEKLISASGQTGVINAFGLGTLSYAGSARSYLYSKFVRGNA